MANIVFISSEEMWCEDCGKLDSTDCNCEECNLCGAYAESDEYKDELKDDKHICEDCYSNLIKQDKYCEECGYLDESVYEVNDMFLCDECNYHMINPLLSTNTTNMLEALGTVNDSA